MRRTLTNRFFLSLLFLIIIVPLSLFAKVHINFSSSKVHGLLMFLEGVSEMPYSTYRFREIFNQSRFNNLKTISNILKYKEFNSKISASYKIGKDEMSSYRDVKELIVIQTAFSKNIDDLSERIMGILPVKMQSEFMSILKFWEPIYDFVVWKPFLSNFLKSKDNFIALSETNNTEEKLSRIARFYSVDWPDNMPIEVSLVPVPNKKGGVNTHSASIGNFESIQIAIPHGDLVGSFGVLVHEICHSFFEIRSKQVKNRLNQWYSKNGSKYSVFTNRILNEGLATAIGNGWIYKQLTGNLDKTDWYDDKYINGFAKGIYPIVEKYLSNKRPIDRNFVNETIKVYEKIFPDVILDIEANLFELNLIYSFDLNKQISDILRSVFKVPSIWASSPPDDESAYESFLKFNKLPALFIVDKDGLKTLDLYFDKVPHLKGFVVESENSDKPLFMNSIDNDNRLFLALYIPKTHSVKETFQKVKRVKIFDFDKPVRILE